MPEDAFETIFYTVKKQIQRRPLRRITNTRIRRALKKWALFVSDYSIENVGTSVFFFFDQYRQPRKYVHGLPKPRKLYRCLKRDLNHISVLYKRESSRVVAVSKKKCNWIEKAILFRHTIINLCTEAQCVFNEYLDENRLLQTSHLNFFWPPHSYLRCLLRFPLLKTPW